MSKLQPVSIGIVAVNKPLETDLIEVTPIESMPMLDGELTDTQANYKAQGKDADDKAYETEIKATATVKAKWLKLGSMNRKTSPDVRRGERVYLYRFADSDEYWWMTLHDDLHLRKLETVIYAFSGTKVEGAEVNADNYYFMEISTHAKVVHFHTSKADGEPFVYDIQINTKDGIITITDDIGNTYFMNSKERQQKMVNPDGSFIEINKADITQECPGTLTQKASKIIQQSTSHSISNDDMQLASGTFKGNAGGGDLVIGSISHVKHKHGGVRSGGDTSGTPV
jgi:hypothetical protein